MSTATLSLDGVTSAEDVTLNTDGTLRGTGTAELTGALTLAGTNHTITTPALADELVLSGVIEGVGGFSKAGAGTVTLTATNTYEGATHINGGVLSISSDANLGAAPLAATPDYLTLDGGTLQATESFALNANRGVALGAGGGTFDVDPTRL